MDRLKIYAKTVEDTAAAQIKEMSECDAYNDCMVRKHNVPEAQRS